jgi:hypothetical protein
MGFKLIKSKVGEISIAQRKGGPELRKLIMEYAALFDEHVDELTIEQLQGLARVNHGLLSLSLGVGIHRTGKHPPLSDALFSLMGPEE